MAQDISVRYEMKLWASEMVLCQLQKSCIKFNNNKLNSFHNYNTGQNYTQSGSAFVPT
jgi:hypothetical protein